MINMYHTENRRKLSLFELISKDLLSVDATSNFRKFSSLSRFTGEI